jgi:hypothetical protein
LRAREVFRKVTPVALLLAFAGYLGPWVDHQAAALVLSGQDMGEFVKFLPEVREGKVFMERLLFYLPPLATAVGLALLAGMRDGEGRWRMAYPWPVAIFLAAAVWPVSLTLLPPVWSPEVLTDDEFRLQFFAFLFCLALAGLRLLVGTERLLRRLPAQALPAVVGCLCLAAAALACWQFLTIKPAIDQVYGHPVRVGWGFVLTMVGLLAVTVVALWAAVGRSGPRAAP